MEREALPACVEYRVHLAVVAARELEITLTSRNKEKGAAIPMCGVPFHAAEGYISRLIQK